MLPEGMAKGYSGPASALAQENIIWTRKMFEASTDALNVVRDAIRDGRLDLERLHPVEERMKALQKGPWTGDTVRHVVKAYVNDVPVVGPMFDLLADD